MYHLDLTPKSYEVIFIMYHLTPTPKSFGIMDDTNLDKEGHNPFEISGVCTSQVELVDIERIKI
jgi:hypothetical protein